MKAITIAVLSASSLLALVAVVLVCTALSQTPQMNEKPMVQAARTNLASTDPQLGLALSGGGFLAMASYTGIIVGYDQLTADSREGTTVASILRDSVETISSVSGGSWFSSEMIYSDTFNKLLDTMTANISGVADMYNTHWNDKFFAGIGGDPFGTSEKIKEPAEQWLQAAKFMEKHGLSWVKFISILLDSTAGIDSKVLLSSKPQSWAQGKKWLIDHSILTQKTSIWASKHCLDKVYTDFVKPTGLDMFTPAAFSVTLGSKVGSTAPYPYCPKCEDSAMQTKVEADNSFVFFHHSEKAFSTTGDINSAFKQDMSQMRVSDVAASSSAFLGGMNAEGWDAGGGSTGDAIDLAKFFGVDCLTTNLAVPMVNQAGQDAFDAADKLLAKLTTQNDDPQDLLDSLASNSIRMVADGALTDNTGIAMLVANNHSTITAFVPYTASEGPPFQDLKQLFGACSSTLTPTGEVVPVFAGNCEDVESMVADTFISFPIVDNAQHLVSLRLGTMYLTTIDYPPLDIKAGTKVRLNAVLLASSLGMADSNMNKFGQFVEEIIKTFSLNQDKTAEVLEKLQL